MNPIGIFCCMLKERNYHFDDFVTWIIGELTVICMINLHNYAGFICLHQSPYHVFNWKPTVLCSADLGLSASMSGTKFPGQHSTDFDSLWIENPGDLWQFVIFGLFTVGIAMRFSSPHNISGLQQPPPWPMIRDDGIAVQKASHWLCLSTDGDTQHMHSYQTADF